MLLEASDYSALLIHVPQDMVMGFALHGSLLVCQQSRMRPHQYRWSEMQAYSARYLPGGHPNMLRPDANRLPAAFTS